MMHVFGIGQGYKPYPTNDASASWYAVPIYKPFLPVSVDRSFDPICCIFMQIGKLSFLLHKVAAIFEASFS